MFGPHQRIQPRISKKKQKKQKKNKKKNITFQLFEFNRTHKWFDFTEFNHLEVSSVSDKVPHFN